MDTRILAAQVEARLIDKMGLHGRDLVRKEGDELVLLDLFAIVTATVMELAEDGFLDIQPVGVDLN